MDSWDTEPQPDILINKNKRTKEYLIFLFKIYCGLLMVTGASRGISAIVPAGIWI